MLFSSFFFFSFLLVPSRSFSYLISLSHTHTGVLSCSPANGKRINSIIVHSTGFVCGCDHGVVLFFDKNGEDESSTQFALMKTLTVLGDGKGDSTKTKSGGASNEDEMMLKGKRKRREERGRKRKRERERERDFFGSFATDVSFVFFISHRACVIFFEIFFFFGFTNRLNTLSFFSCPFILFHLGCNIMSVALSPNEDMLVVTTSDHRMLQMPFTGLEAMKETDCHFSPVEFFVVSFFE